MNSCYLCSTPLCSFCTRCHYRPCSGSRGLCLEQKEQCLIQRARQAGFVVSVDPLRILVRGTERGHIFSHTHSGLERLERFLNRWETRGPSLGSWLFKAFAWLCHIPLPSNPLPLLPPGEYPMVSHPDDPESLY